MSNKILVIGGTGMLGLPVAKRLKADGFEVTIMSTNVEKSKQAVSDSFNLVEGDVTKPDTLKSAIEGNDFVYLNLNSHLDPDRYQAIEIAGTKNVATACAKLGVKRIGMISGASSEGVEKSVIYLDAKVNAEKALMDCGVPYTIMRPSWFFESLPGFVRGDKAGVLGKQPIPRKWLAADDFAGQVSVAFKSEEAANKCFYNYGPNEILMLDAVTAFCAKHYPEIQPMEVSFMMAKLAQGMPGMEELKAVIPFFEFMEKQGEPGDGAEADRVLGKNTTTLEQWIGNWAKPQN